MSRRGNIVDKIQLFKYKMMIPIKLVKGDGSHGSGKVWFEAEVGGEVLKNPDYSALEKEINDRARIMFTAEWKPIIKIKTEAIPNETLRIRMEFSFRRFYYSRVGNAWCCVDWEEYVETQKTNGRIKELNLIRVSELWHDASGEGGIPDDDINTSQYSKIDYRKKRNRGQVIEQKIGTYYRPYTEELWHGLCQLKEMVARTSMRLTEILGSDE